MNIIALEALTFGLGHLSSAARKNGCRLTLLTRDKSLYDYELSQQETGDVTVIELDTFNNENVVAALQHEPDIAGILSTTDTWSFHCLEISKKLGLPHHDPYVIGLVRDKYRLRNHLYNEGLSSCTSKLVNPRDYEREVVTADVKYPCIVKDTAGTGSQYVWIAYNENDLLTVLDHASTQPLRGLLTIEPFFSGTLYSLETLSWEGETRLIAITSRVISPEPLFREEAFSSPVHFPDALMDSLETWIRKVLSSIGYQRGFAHTEFMITDDGFEVIEINPRLGGVQIGEALCRSFGINIYESWVEMALNKRPELMDMHLRDKKGIGQLIVYAEQSGIFSHIEGLDRLVNHPGAPVFYPTAVKGKRIDTIDDQRASIGILLAEGDSSEIALLNAYAARNKLKVVMKSTDE
ncbi:ATP-grasp domain-containing protein [Escherichia coli]|uniref:ATP-grasp domain-containing protein n=3 Tax=Escherichia coli TaxID=562 RepID=A0A6L6ZKK8_ECOLX|nr:ATP-grasp domain-containing protein [Escherichia coli]MWU50320.1 ATP-grasp domain-containing protein [Escherichia coli]MWU55176.1 ATP-grasp domain-containing protein [Escherichia coli]